MATIDVVNTNSKKVKSVDVKDGIFTSEVNDNLLYAAINWQRAKRRAGTASTKTRGQVKHTTAKPFKQKGTGRARQGMSSSPVLVGGGTVFGPHPRDYSYKMNKKMKVGALRSALSYKFKEGKVKVVDSIELSEIKTKSVVEMLKAFNTDNALIVDGKNENLQKSARNLRTSKYIDISGLNVYDILKYDYLILTEKALPELDRLSK